ncbi:MAG: zinc ribbon domain-containing protein [Candidatus Gracilibacteria bacterium]|nr:zinc ribbon domain-containing protein [Candidatus Gracilibacteria bacterium]
MECPSCNKKINDNSKFCRYCGAEQEPGFCTACGTSVGGKSSKQSGVLILLVLVGLVGFAILRGSALPQDTQIKPATTPQFVQETGPGLIERAQELIFSSEAEKDYDVLYSTSMSFSDSTTYEIYLLVKEGESKRNQVEFAKEEIGSLSAREARDIVLLYTCEKLTCQETGEFLGEFVSVDRAQNPNYVLETDFEFLTDSLALRWNDNV